MIAFVRFVHLTSIAFWAGATTFLFVLAPGVFAALPKPVAGDAMNAIFPRFYALSLLCAALAACTLPLLPERSTARGALLTAAIALLVLAGPVLGARAAAVREKRAQAEAAVAAGAASGEFEALKKEFGMLHGVVTLLDLTMLGACLAMLWLGISALAPPGPTGGAGGAT